MTSTVPTDWAGETTVMDVELLTTTLVPGRAPKLTVAPVANWLPVIVTDVPPAIGPEFGLTTVTVGVPQ